MAVAAATNSAILKVADVVASVAAGKKKSSHSKRNDSNDDDEYDGIFEDYENMIIQAKKSAAATT